MVAKLNGTINQILEETWAQERLKAIGFDPIFKTNVEAAEYFKSEVARWGTMVRATGVTVD